MKVYTFEPNIRLIRLFSLMLNYAKPLLSHQLTSNTEKQQIFPRVHKISILHNFSQGSSQFLYNKNSNKLCSLLKHAEHFATVTF